MGRNQQGRKHEVDDDRFVLFEHMRAMIGKHIPLARDPAEQKRVDKRLQAIAAKKNGVDPQAKRKHRAWLKQRMRSWVDDVYRNRVTASAAPQDDEAPAWLMDRVHELIDRVDTVDDESEAGPASLKRESSSVIERLPRKRRAIEEALSDSLTEPPTYGLRQRAFDPETPSASDQRAARLARRAKPFPSIEKSGRTTLRSHSSAFDEYSSDEDEMAGEDDKEQTFTKEYVDARPDQTFHHTGNGWYKKGLRPRGKGKQTKEHNFDALTLTKEPDGSLNYDALDPEKSMHGSELVKYPGKEFHHCGNGYYRPGPDPKGKRTSITVEIPKKSDEGEAMGGTVDKAHKDAHPAVEWVHRGNGRYMRKADIMKDTAVVSPVATINSDRRKSEPTYDKAYVTAHPDEDFYHTGNARWKRGVRRSGKLNVPAAESEEAEDMKALYDKAYVEAHPDQVFHHRGQGRYARGPRPNNTPARDAVTAVDDDEDEDDEEEEEEEEDASEEDLAPGTLVDTSYVDSHPNQTFYHRGQGRWAFGLPPPGSHNKIAVRGPGAQDRAAARASEEEDEADKAPAITALVTRAEGPELFPNLDWHYRGGGKWGRVTKQEWEQITYGTVNYKPTTISKYGGKKQRMSKANDGPKAQLEREAAAAERAAAGQDEDAMLANSDTDMVGTPVVQKPKVKRGRRSNREIQSALEEMVAVSNEPSKSQSKAATPRLPMLAPEDDVLDDDDFPSLYGGSWSDITPIEDDEADRYLRQAFLPLNTDKVVRSLTKHEPGVRSLTTLKAIADHSARIMRQLQKEYIQLDTVIAPHAKIPRKPAKGGQAPIDPHIFEDRKEADLYDYVYDPRKLGFQDPDFQRIIRDAEGRELRKRRHRSGVEPTDTVPGWHFGEGSELAPKRASRQPNRFDAVVEPPRKRARLSNGVFAGSMTPDRAATPLGGPLRGAYGARGGSRLAVGHVPKRVRELRDGSEVSVVRSEGGTESKTRKGRPPGSKNLHKRSDAGIKKGPRKPKVVPSIEAQTEMDAEAEAEAEMEGLEVEMGGGMEDGA